MITDIIPKLPMRDKKATQNFYKNLGFSIFGNDFEGYLMIQKDNLQIHFFEFQNLIPSENYGQIYIRTTEINKLYDSYVKNNIVIHPNGKLELKSWGQKEFSLLDPDSNLITFGESVN
ncbi:VOC family protein [Chryseobacterium sp. RR2-3-20]|uniref:bleomycin resistance protein n=1 Tax=Chryseobacterium sp. RR2-3-20 TaxID=2787626 RepID=UPI001ADFB04D|nr:VOC family protein [Chryseobacterium sp. RR2-3-20]